MKCKIAFPDWLRMAVQINTRKKENDPQPVWREYDQDPAGDSLSLRVTLESPGVRPSLKRSTARKPAAYLERSCRVTYANALGFAERLWRAAPSREYVVLFK